MVTNMSANEKIRMNIKWLRKAYNLSQDQLAGMIGVNRPLVGAWEEGRSIPRPDELIAISDYFRVPIDDLLRVEMSRCYVVETVQRLAKLTIEK